MIIYLLRHGLAKVPSAETYPDDSLRPLTAKGRDKTRRLAQGLAALETEFDRVLTSPYLRAKETADLVVKELKVRIRLGLADELTPAGDPKKLIERINQHPPKAILLVGHEPYLSQLISVLLTGHAGLPLELKKGGLCRLRTEALSYSQCAVLESLLTPKQLVQAGQRS